MKRNLIISSIISIILLLSGIFICIYGESIKYDYPCNIINCINVDHYMYLWSGFMMITLSLLFLFLIIIAYKNHNCEGNDE